MNEKVIRFNDKGPYQFRLVTNLKVSNEAISYDYLGMHFTYKFDLLAFKYKESYNIIDTTKLELLSIT